MCIITDLFAEDSVAEKRKHLLFHHLTAQERD